MGLWMPSVLENHMINTLNLNSELSIHFIFIHSFFENNCSATVYVFLSFLIWVQPFDTHMLKSCLPHWDWLTKVSSSETEISHTVKEIRQDLRCCKEKRHPKSFPQSFWILTILLTNRLISLKNWIICNTDQDLVNNILACHRNPLVVLQTNVTAISNF